MHRNSGSVRPYLAHCVIWLCAMAVPAATAAAQDNPAAAPAPQDAARAAYGRGVEAFSAESFTLAHEQFSLAEQAFPSPNIELMLGRTLAKLERFVEARAVLQRAQAGSISPKYANTAKLATAELAIVEKQVARVDLDIEDPKGDERLLVNGVALEQSAWAEPLLLDPGSVRIELSRPGVAPAVEQLDLTPGAHERVALRVVIPEPTSPAKAVAEAAPPRSVPLGPSPSKPHEGRSPWLRGLSYALAGVGVAGFVGFAGFGAYSHGHYNKLEELCPPDRECHSSYRWLATKGRTYQTLANVSLVAGSVALAAGVTLWVVTLLPGRAEVEVTASSVQIRGSF